MVCTSLGSLLRPLFYFLDNVSYPQSVDYVFERGEDVSEFTLYKIVS